MECGCGIYCHMSNMIYSRSHDSIIGHCIYYTMANSSGSSGFGGPNYVKFEEKEMKILDGHIWNHYGAYLQALKKCRKSIIWT